MEFLHDAFHVTLYFYLYVFVSNETQTISENQKRKHDSLGRFHQAFGVS